MCAASASVFSHKLTAFSRGGSFAHCPSKKPPRKQLGLNDSREAAAAAAAAAAAEAAAEAAKASCTCMEERNSPIFTSRKCHCLLVLADLASNSQEMH